MTIPMFGMLGNVAQHGQMKSLLKQAKQQAGLLDEEEMPQTPAFNPNAPDPRQTSPMGDPTHAHRGGLIGRIGHAMGGDRIQPEMAALLTPDQQSRVRRGPGGALLDYLVRGETTGEAQVRRGTEMLTLADQKKARDKAARDEQMWAQVQEVASKIPDPQARLEYTARMAASLGLAQGEMTSQAAQRLEEPTRAPIQEQFSNAQPMMIDGKVQMVQMGNLGTRRIVEGAAPVERPQTPDEPQIVRGVVGPDGRPMIQGRDRNGRVVWEAPEDATDPEQRAAVAAQERRNDGLRVVTDDLNNINEALAQVETNPSAFGIKNALPTMMRQRLPGRDAEADATTLGSLEYVVGRLRHDRFGGALSALEASKAARIFSEPTSPPEVVRAQLNVVRDALMRQQRTLSRQSGGAAAGAPTAGGRTVTVNGKTFRIPE